MDYYELSDEYRVNTQGTSDGTQIKYFKDNIWYKIDNYGGEGLNEYLATILLNNSNLSSSEYVCYEECYINYHKGCKSNNFLNENEEFVTLYRLYSNYHGGNIAKDIAFMCPEDQLSYVLDFIAGATGITETTYLGNMLALDRIMLNDDRNVNNIGFIFDGEHFSPAPIFDNGESLFCGNYSYRNKWTLEENLNFVGFKPFKGEYALNNLDITMQFNYHNLRKDLAILPDSEEKNILLENIELTRYKYPFLYNYERELER